MAIITVPEFAFPSYGTIDYTALTTLAITASGNKVVFVLRSPKAGSISRIGFLLGTVTTPGTLRISLQDLDVDGLPDGTPDQFYNLVNPAQGWQSGTLSVPRIVALGEAFAVVIELTTVGSMLISCVATAGAVNRNVFQGANYVILNTTKQPTVTPSVDVEWSDASREIIHGNYPFLTLGTFGSPGIRVGFRFKPGAVIRVKGLWARVGVAAVTDTFDFELWDQLDAVVRTVSMTPRKSVITAGVFVPYVGYFSTPYSVPVGAEIYGIMRSTAGTVSISNGTVYGGAGVIREGLPGGKEFWMVNRSGSVWDSFLGGDSKSIYWPHMGMIIDGLEEGATSAATTNVVSSSNIFALKVRSKV